jgi:hypothetical protein
VPPRAASQILDALVAIRVSKLRWFSHGQGNPGMNHPPFGYGRDRERVEVTVLGKPLEVVTGEERATVA